MSDPVVPGKYDFHFNEALAFSSSRIKAMSKLSHTRNFFRGAAWLASILVIWLSFNGAPAGPLVLGAALLWMTAFKYDSDIRLVRAVSTVVSLIESGRLQRPEDRKDE